MLERREQQPGAYTDSLDSSDFTVLPWLQARAFRKSQTLCVGGGFEEAPGSRGGSRTQGCQVPATALALEGQVSRMLGRSPLFHFATPPSPS